MWVNIRPHSISAKHGRDGVIRSKPLGVPDVSARVQVIHSSPTVRASAKLRKQQSRSSYRSPWEFSDEQAQVSASE